MDSLDDAKIFSKMLHLCWFCESSKKQQIFESLMIQPSIGKRQYAGHSWYALPNYNGKSKPVKKPVTNQLSRFDSCSRYSATLGFSDRILSDPCSERLHFQPKLQKTLVILPHRISGHWYDDHQLSACRAPAHSLECNGFCPEQPPWVANVCRDQILGALMKGKRVNIYWEPIESCFLSCCFESLLDLPLSNVCSNIKIRVSYRMKTSSPAYGESGLVQVFKTICFGHSYLKYPQVYYESW